MAGYRINPGDLRYRITIEKYAPYEDEFGFTKDNWEDYKTVWCNANNVYGEEFWRAKEAGYENVVMFTIRFSKDVANINSREYRINWKGRLFNIISVDNIQYADEVIRIRAKEVEV